MTGISWFGTKETWTPVPVSETNSEGLFLLNNPFESGVTVEYFSSSLLSPSTII
jgi:hypothetical protein